MSRESIRQEDIPTVNLGGRKKHQVDIGISSIIGTRKVQQDTVFAQTGEKGTLAIVCDGMGGLKSGELASRTAAEMLAADFFDAEELGDIPEFLQQEAVKIDSAVFRLRGEDGESLETGTTMVAAVVTEDRLHWLSVGDSRIYLLRGTEMVAASRTHNYRYALDQQRKNGQITQQYYEEQAEQGDALISYIGMGNVSLMDVNQSAFQLQDGDMILLCSDGLYRSLSPERIQQIVREQIGDIEQAAHYLCVSALDASPGAQDNTSLVLMRYHK